MRSAGGVLIEEIDGSLYIARGMALAGVAIDVTLRTDAVLRANKCAEPMQSIQSFLSAPWYGV